MGIPSFFAIFTKGNIFCDFMFASLDNAIVLNEKSGPGCSKLTTSLVNVSLKFHTLKSNIHHYFLLKKCETLLQCKSFSHFFNKKYQCIWL